MVNQQIGWNRCGNTKNEQNCVFWWFIMCKIPLKNVDLHVFHSWCGVWPDLFTAVLCVLGGAEGSLRLKKRWTGFSLFRWKYKHLNWVKLIHSPAAFQIRLFAILNQSLHMSLLSSSLIMCTCHLPNKHVALIGFFFSFRLFIFTIKNIYFAFSEQSYHFYFHL